MTYNPVEGMEHLEANHLDEDKINNCLNNLCWMTPRENINYGTRNERTANANSKPVICVETNKIYKNAIEVKKELGLDSSYIGKCCRG